MMCAFFYPRPIYLNGGERGPKKIATAAEMLIILMVALALKKKSRFIGATSHI